MIAGDTFRKTRLHDEKGNRIPARELRHVPLNLYWTARRRVTGRLPQQPWLTFDAVSTLECILDPTWHLLEFGSGMSTAWYATRVRTVHSIESDPAWYTRLSGRMPTNVRYELRDRGTYVALDDYAPGTVDIGIVDGIDRDRCVEALLPLVRPGGYLLLDNSDKDMTRPGGGLRRAEQLLRDAVDARHGTLTQRTGLAIGLLVANQWTLARL